MNALVGNWLVVLLYLVDSILVGLLICLRSKALFVTASVCILITTGLELIVVGIFLYFLSDRWWAWIIMLPWFIIIWIGSIPTAVFSIKYTACACGNCETCCEGPNPAAGTPAVNMVAIPQATHVRIQQPGAGPGVVPAVQALEITNQQAGAESGLVSAEKSGFATNV